jgi:hypothetical protein
MVESNWVKWQSQVNDSESAAIEKRTEIRTLGEYEPGHPPVIFNPLSTGDEVPEATLWHEATHGELTRATAFGLFFETLYMLGDADSFRDLISLAGEWRTQESCATYAGLTMIAYRKPEHVDEAIANLPSERTGQSPYREAFDAVSSVVPIEKNATASRLQALGFFVTGIGRLSMDNDCLMRFSNPATTNLESLRGYLDTQSPDLRFSSILNTLKGRPEIGQIIDAVEREVAANGLNPVRTAMGAIAGLIPEIHLVSFAQLKEQHAQFRKAWQPVVDRYAPQESDPETWDQTPKIPAVSATGKLTMTLDSVREFLVGADAGHYGLWAVIAAQDKSEILLDLMAYQLGQNGNPLSELAAAEAVLHVGFKSGRFSTNKIIEIFDQFPSLPQAITFMGASWYEWEQFAQGHVAGQKSVQVCLTRNLSEISLQVMLAFRNLRSRAKYFLTAFDKDHAFAYFADPNQPGSYGMQYLAGGLGLRLFSQMAEKFDLVEQKDLDTKILHLGLLNLMSLPAFLPPQGDGT